MDDALILAELEAQAQTMPSFESEASIGDSEHRWLGRTLALLNEWDGMRAISVRVASRYLYGMLIDQNAATIRTTTYEAIAALRLKVQQKPGSAFAASAVYDFFREFKSVVGLATKDLLVIDPYRDDEIFTYLSVVPAGASLRLMMTQQRLIPIVKAAQAKFQQQYQRQAETRATASIHDRVVFVDGQTCYVLGASIKDAAQKKPTYLAPLAADLVQDKLAIYESIWRAAAPI